MFTTRTGEEKNRLPASGGLGQDAYNIRIYPCTYLPIRPLRPAGAAPVGGNGTGHLRSAEPHDGRPVIRSAGPESRRWTVSPGRESHHLCGSRRHSPLQAGEARPVGYRQSRQDQDQAGRPESGAFFPVAIQHILQRKIGRQAWLADSAQMLLIPINDFDQFFAGGPVLEQFGVGV